MATPVDGPGSGYSGSNYTWGSKFGWLKWINNQDGTPKPFYANATTTENSLLFTGGTNYEFSMFGGYGYIIAYAYSNPNYTDGLIPNSIYLPFFVGATFTPGGQGVVDPWGYRVPCPPFQMQAELFDSGVTGQTIYTGFNLDYFGGVDGVEGFVDRN